MSDHEAPHPGRSRFTSLTILLLAELAGMSLWFVSAAILPDMVAESHISSTRQAAMSSSVQAGFVVGALFSAISGLADRIDPRRVFAVCAVLAALANASLLVTQPGGNLAIAARFATGALLAGVYPVGLKIVVGWGLKDRGFLVSILIGAFTLGSAAPYLLAYVGGTEWRWAVTATSVAAAAGGIACLLTGLGPHHSSASRFDIRTISEAWTNKRVRLANAGYLGHMWELYAMWSWIGVASAASYAATLPGSEATSLGRLTAFCAIAAGGIACVVAGPIADRTGKARIAIYAMVISGSGALLTALSFGGPPWLTFAFAILWGASVLPDSAQFSTLVADHSPPEKVGSLLTLQTALGFALTFFTVQATPLLAGAIGWPIVMVLMALGPVAGTIAMIRFRALP
ncbi:nitrate/nitrite transporter [Roseibium sp. RKSG952]|uniref:MFS transporter n=1 Tax=Roseibium sp. RKSG952 TaxID=2529384 RepID=UPI0012BCB9D1|nr:MFS transporter [Roseibium sp. RKSG952]MTI00310.1 MFS transporter [Roseibium sp. RKSG952]